MLHTAKPTFHGVYIWGYLPATVLAKLLACQGVMMSADNGIRAQERPASAPSRQCFMS